MTDDKDSSTQYTPSPFKIDGVAMSTMAIVIPLSLNKDLCAALDKFHAYPSEVIGHVILKDLNIPCKRISGWVQQDPSIIEDTSHITDSPCVFIKRFVDVDCYALLEIKAKKECKSVSRLVTDTVRYCLEQQTYLHWFEPLRGHKDDD